MSIRKSNPRRLNVKLLVGTLVVCAVAAPTIFLWHRQQLRRVSAALLQRADELSHSGDDAQAANYLYRCLQLSQQDPGRARELTVRLAQSYDRSVTGLDKSTVINWYYRAIALAPDDPTLQLRLAEIFLETRQFVLAERQVRPLLDAQSVGAEPRRIAALARYGQFRQGRPILPQEILTELQDAHRRAPGDVDVAEALAYVYREATPASDTFEPSTRADAVMDVLVRNASREPRAYLARHRYRIQYRLAADDRDLRKALELAPQDPACLLAMAEQSQQSGDWQRAVEQFRGLVATQPLEFRGHLGLGESLYRLGQVPQAIEAWQHGLGQVAIGRMAILVRLTDALIEDRQLPAAAQQLQRLDAAIRYLATTEGEHQRGWVVASRDLLQAKLFMQQDQYQAAVPLLQRVATTAKADRSQAPEVSPAYQSWLLLGQCNLRLQQWEDAATSFQRALQIVPASLTARLWAAQAWAAVGRDDQAILFCEQAAARQQAPDEIWLMLAQLHLRTQMRLPPAQRDWERLEQVLQQAAQALPDSWEIPIVRANLLLVRDGAQGTSRAMQLLLAEESAHPNSVPLWSNLVFLYERLGMPTEADRAWQRLSEINPSRVQSTAWQVALQAVRGNFAAAQQLLAATPATNQAEVEWLDRARLFLVYQQGDLAQIRESLLKMQAERPQGTHVLSQLADLALIEGNWVEVDRWIARLREAEGSDGIWWRFYQAQRLLATEHAADGGVSAQVVSLHEDLRRLRPWWPGTAMLRGLLAEAQGRADEASEAYANAIRSGFQQPHVYERLIRVLYELGRFEAAEGWLTQLQQQAPLDVRVLDLAWSSAVQRNQLDLALRIARQNLRQHPQQPAAYVWLAQMLAIAGEREESRALVEQALALQPQDAATWMGLLAYHLRLGDERGARAALEQVQQHVELPAAQRQAVAAQAYQQLGDRARAEQAFVEAIRLLPDDTELQVRFAAFLHAFAPDRAETELRQTLLRAPQHVAARRLLATWLHGSDDRAAQAEAGELLQSSDADWRQQVADRRLEAVLLMRRGRPEDLQQAMILLEKLVADARAAEDEDHLLLARLLERTGNLAAAEEHLRALASRQPSTGRHLATYADFLLRRQRWDEARPWIERLDEQAPMSLSAVSLRSRLLLGSGQVDQIEPYLEAFARRQLAQLRDAQQRQQLMQQVAELYVAVDRHDAAERWYQQLVTEYPQRGQELAYFWLRQEKAPQAMEFAWRQIQQESTPAAVTLYARALIQSSGPVVISDQAEQVFREVLERYPEDAELWFALASLRLKQNQIPQAIELLRKLTERHPDHVTAWNNLAAVLADDPAQLDEAIRCVDHAIKAAGRPLANLLDTKALILLQQSRDGEAATLLRQVLSLPDGQDPRFHLHLAVAQQRLGELQLARQTWLRSVDLGLARAYLTPYERQLVTDLGKSLAGAGDES